MEGDPSKGRETAGSQDKIIGTGIRRKRLPRHSIKRGAVGRYAIGCGEKKYAYCVQEGGCGKRGGGEKKVPRCIQDPFSCTWGNGAESLFPEKKGRRR